MRRFLKPLLFIIVISLSALFIVRFLFGGNEDAWICQNGSWVKHGNPSKPMPETGCGDQGKTATSKQNEFNSGQKYEIYQTDNFEIKYPYWQNVDPKNILAPQKTKLAVTDGKCNFVITAVSIPLNTIFKDYTENQLKEQTAQIKSKVISQEIKDKSAYFEAEMTIGNTILYSISYSYLTGKNQSYGVAFVAPKDQFEEACRPIISEVVGSVKVK